MNEKSSPRVLLIEDDPLLRQSLALALERSGHTVRTTDNEADGIRLAGEFSPHLVISDIHLSSGDGRSLLQTLRANERTAMSQFVLMTGDQRHLNARLGMNLGADDYLEKPFTIDEFLDCVRARLGRSELIHKAESQAVSRLRGTVLHTLPHELFTPLAGVLGLSEVLLEDLEELSQKEVKDMVKSIHESGERLLRTLRSYLTILEITDAPASPAGKAALLSPEETADIIAATATTAATKHGRDGDIVFDLGTVGLPVGKTNLTVIVSEWIDNACKFSAAKTPIRVALSAHGAVVRLEISDAGRGMAENQVRQIGAFKQFDRTKYEQQGLGLGLTLTQHFIEQAGGRFRIDTQVSKGTTLSAEWTLESPVSRDPKSPPV